MEVREQLSPLLARAAIGACTEGSTRGGGSSDFRAGLGSKRCGVEVTGEERTGGVDDEDEVAAAGGGGRGGGVVGREADGAQLGVAARGSRPDQRRPRRRRRGHDVAVCLSRFDCTHTLDEKVYTDLKGAVSWNTLPNDKRHYASQGQSITSTWFIW